jgi:outer membrane protein assembly factor BamB
MEQPMTLVQEAPANGGTASTSAPKSLLYLGTKGYATAIDQRTGAEIWRTSLPSSGWDAVTVLREGEYLFFASHGHVYRLDPASGSIMWHNELSGLGIGPITLLIDQQPIRGTKPLLYLGTIGWLAALQPEDGIERWRTSFPSTGWNPVSMIFNQWGNILACTSGKCFQVNENSGHIMWTNELPGLGHQFMCMTTCRSYQLPSTINTSADAAQPGGFSSASGAAGGVLGGVRPVAGYGATGQGAIANANSLQTGVGALGDPRTAQPHPNLAGDDASPPPPVTLNQPAGAGMSTTISEENFVFLGTRGTVLALDTSNGGAEAWRLGLPLSGFGIANLRFDHGVLLAAAGGHVFAIHPLTGQIIWENFLPDLGFSHVCMTSNLSMSRTKIDARPTERKIFVGTYGHVVALRQATGREIWRCSLPITGYSIVTVLYDDGQLFAGTNGKIFCLDSETGIIDWENDLAGLGYQATCFATDNISMNHAWDPVPQMCHEENKQLQVPA